MGENTFGEYEFADWVPGNVSEEIVTFWGCLGRTHNEWLANAKHDEMERCAHGARPNGFGHPPNGATVEYVFLDWKLSKETGKEVYKIVKGRYIHAWSNIGRLVDEHGETHYPSTCDRWVRVFANDTGTNMSLKEALDGI